MTLGCAADIQQKILWLLSPRLGGGGLELGFGVRLMQEIWDTTVPTET